MNPSRTAPRAMLLLRVMFYIACGLCIYVLDEISEGQDMHVASWIDTLPGGGFIVVEHDDTGLVLAYAPWQRESRARPPLSYPMSRIFRNFPYRGVVPPAQLNVTFNPSGKLMLVPVHLYHMPENAPPLLYEAICLLLPCVGAIDIAHVWRFFNRLKRSYSGRCSKCGYDLRASPTRCPECEAAFPHLWRGGRRWIE